MSRYLLGRRKTGPDNRQRNARLTWSLVRDIRRWASAQVGMSHSQKVRALQQQYPLAYPTLGQILRNQTWWDPSYQPEAIDATRLEGLPMALVVLQVYANAARD